jgi:DNA processing protein
MSAGRRDVEPDVAHAVGRPARTRAETESHRAGLGLSWVAATGCRAPLRLLTEHPVEEVWGASIARLQSWGMSAQGAARVAERREQCRLDALCASLAASGLYFHPHGSALYPAALAELTLPPAGVYVAGTQEQYAFFLAARRVTMVGTRRASAAGLEAADTLAAAFAAAGVLVVSGMALGIDARCHLGCLRAGGTTAAVLGSGADTVYPRRHLSLYRRIQESGVVLSELPPGAAPAPWTFPLRNRLLAALGDALVVVEAGERSGALLTCDWALEVGREVFAVPGAMGSEESAGANRLLYDGAVPAVSPRQTVEDFLRATRNMSRDGAADRQEGGSRQGCGLTPEDRLIELALGGSSASLDDLRSATGLSARQLGAGLSRLELRGMIAEVESGRFVLLPIGSASRVVVR